MRHIFIVATARTGGTWLGKVLDTGPHVKYLWEPDSHRRLMEERFRQWEHGDPEKMRMRIERYIPHQKIRPEFPKERITTAVYKLYSVCGDVAFMIDAWPDEFLRLREKLDAKVIHLMRHPARWAASVTRWCDRPLKPMLKMYSEGNVGFWKQCRGQPWYMVVKHEDATAMPRAVFDSIFQFCRIVYDQEYMKFVRQMHAKDERPEPDQHSTTMTRGTVLMRWRDLDKDEFALANDSVSEYWEGIYRRLLRISYV